MINNTNKRRIRLVSLLMAALITLNLFLPSGSSYAADHDASVMNNVSLTLSQDGVPIADAGNLAAEKDISLRLEFSILTGTGPGQVQKGQTMEFVLCNGFKLNREYRDYVFYAEDTDTGEKFPAGKFNLYNDGDIVKATIIFDGVDTAFTFGDMVIAMDASMKYAGDAQNIPDAGITVSFLDKTYTLMPAAPIFEYKMEKTSSLVDGNLKSKKLQWTVTLSATKNSNPFSLEGTKFFDDLTSVGTYVPGSFQVGGSPAEPVIEGGGISYTFPSGAPTGTTVTFQTEIPNNHYYAQDTQKIENTAQLLSSNGAVLKDASHTASFFPVWINKTGKSSDEGSSGAYNPNGRTIEWTITANQTQASLHNVVITDKLGSDKDGLLGQQIFKEAYWQKWDGTQWIDKQSITPNANGEYSLGNINQQILLTIVAEVPDAPGSFTAATVTYENGASIRSDEIGGLILAPVSAKIGFNAITEKAYMPSISDAANLAELKKDLLTWDITVEERQQTIPDLKVYNVLSYTNKAINLKQAQGLPAGFDAAGYMSDSSDAAKDQGLGQRYVDGSFTMKSSGNLSLTKHVISIGGKPVGEVLEITGFNKTQAESFSIKTQVVEPEYQLANSNTVNIKNISTLYSSKARLNRAEAINSQYFGRMIYKEMIDRSKHDDLSANVDVYTEKAELGFNYKDQSIVYRLSINAPGIDFTNREFYNSTTGAFERYGTFTFSDTLPAGWEFVNISGSEKYLLFEGNPARGTSLRTFAMDKTPDALPTDASASVTAASATFSFPTLNKPYVILLKAKPTAAQAENYFTKNETFTVPNTMKFTVSNSSVTRGSSRNTTIISQVIAKSSNDKPSGVVDGTLLWTVDYTPGQLQHTNAIIEDTLPVGIDLPTDHEGELILEEDGVATIKINEITAKPDGTYAVGDPVTPVLGSGGNISYDSASRALRFQVPDGNKSYRLQYLTYITGDPSKVSNQVKLLNTTASNTETKSDFSITDAHVRAFLSKNGYVEITKIDANTSANLENARFNLYTASNNVIKTGLTNSQGKLLLKGIPVGSYTLKEVTAPAGYEESSTTYTVVVEKTPTGKITKIDGVTKNQITVTNRSTRTGQIKVTNRVVGSESDPNKDFTYTVSLPAGNFPYAKSDGTTGTIRNGAKLTLKHDQNFVISQLPNGAAVKVVENPDGYTVTDGANNPLPTATQSETVVLGQVKQLDFVNTKGSLPAASGSIKVTNTVTGTAADPAKEFTYTVTFPGGGTYPYTKSDGTSGTITSGGTVTLTHGQSFTVTGIPGGTVVTVVENPDGYTVTPGASQNATIVTGQQQQLDYVNTKNTSGGGGTTPNPPTVDKGHIRITNEVSGPGADLNKDFVYTIVYNGTERFIYEKNGVAAGTIGSGDTFTLKNGENVLVKDLPKDLIVTVTEDAVDATGYTIEPTTAVITKTIIANDTVLAPFKNTKPLPPVGDIRISNTVTGTGVDLNKPFTYTVTFASSQTYAYDKSDGTSGTIANGGTFTLKHGETFTIKGLPPALDVTVRQNAETSYTTTPGLARIDTILANMMIYMPFVNTIATGGGSTPGGGTSGGGSTPQSPVRPDPSRPETIVPDPTPLAPSVNPNSAVDPIQIDNDPVPTQSIDATSNVSDIGGAPKTGALSFADMARNTLTYALILILLMILFEEYNGKRRSYER